MGSLVLLLSSVACAQHSVIGRWIPRASLPVTSVFSGAAAGPDGRIYIFGGEVPPAESSSAVTRIYDPKSNTWSLGAPMPVATDEPDAALADNGKIYVVGGSLPGPGRHASNANWEYNPIANTWRKRAPMPHPRAALALVAAKDARGRTFLYAIGGRDYLDQRNGLQTLESYDPSTDRWTERCPMPTARHALGAAVASDGNIYVVGGAQSDPLPQFVSKVEVYDPRTDTWTLSKPIPHEAECMIVVSDTRLDGRVYMLGGWYTPDKNNESKFLVRNPKTGDWDELPDAPRVRAAARAVVEVKNHRPVIYFVGGTPNGDSCDEYIPGDEK